MVTSTLDKTVCEPVTMRLARFGASHGYRFDGDTVQLNVMFSVLDPAAHERAWALQLRASPGAPARVDEIAGHIVAEVPLPPIGEVADDTHSFGVSSFAFTPAGQAEHVMVLTLAAKNAGRFNEVHDYAVYPRRERFLQPRLAGNVGFRIEGSRVTIEVERIENPRDAANLSGTLAIELWALPEPYQGGGFNGFPLSGAALAGLSGQCEFRHRSFDLPFTPPPAGKWNLVLMLREWTAAGYITRDFTNFNLPMTVAAPASSASAEADQPARATPASTLKPVLVARGNEPRLQSTAGRPAASHGAVSVNSATKEELLGVKGLPTKVAEGIVSKRPFSSVDELVKVKGMGAKLLAKLRSRLRL